MDLIQNIDTIIEKYPKSERPNLIPLLQDLQEHQGFLSEEAMVKVGKHLAVPVSNIYGVATFYNQFKFEPSGKYHIKVCRGTACHVLGSSTVLVELEKQLKIKAGSTSRDKMFSLEVVACIGACGLAPVISVNDTFHAKVSAASIKEIIESYKNM